MTWLRIILRVSTSTLSVDVLTMKRLDLEAEPTIASCQSHDEQLRTIKFQGEATCLLRLQRCSRHDHKYGSSAHSFSCVIFHSGEVTRSVPWEETRVGFWLIDFQKKERGELGHRRKRCNEIEGQREAAAAVWYVVWRIDPSTRLEANKQPVRGRVKDLFGDGASWRPSTPAYVSQPNPKWRTISAV